MIVCVTLFVKMAFCLTRIEEKVTFSFSSSLAFSSPHYFDQSPIYTGWRPALLYFLKMVISATLIKGFLPHPRLGKIASKK